MNGTGPVAAERERGAEAQRADRRLQGSPSGASAIPAPVPAGAPPWEALAADTDKRHRQKKGGGGPLEPGWPAPAVSHSHLILVYRLHQLAPRVEVGASPKTGAPALQQTPGHLRHGRCPPRPLPPLPQRGRALGRHPPRAWPRH